MRTKPDSGQRRLVWEWSQLRFFILNQPGEECGFYDTMKMERLGRDQISVSFSVPLQLFEPSTVNCLEEVRMVVDVWWCCGWCCCRVLLSFPRCGPLLLLPLLARQSSHCSVAELSHHQKDVIRHTLLSYWHTWALGGAGFMMILIK